MPFVHVTTPFRWAYDGVNVVDYGVGYYELPARAAEICLAEGWGTLADDNPPAAPVPGVGDGDDEKEAPCEPSKKARQGAPRNKDKGPSPRNKAASGKAKPASRRG